MPIFFADLVREFTHAGGAGPLVLEGAVPGHRRFGDVVPPGASFHYAIAGVADPAQWETGLGAIDAQGRLARTPSASSSAGAAVDFATGLKTVALTVSAGWFAAEEAVAARRTGRTAAALLNGWTNYSPIFSTPGYARDGSGRVFLEGTIKGGTTTGYTTLFTLPAGYRPGLQQMLPAATNAGIGIVNVTPAGDVKYVSGGASYFSLTGLNFLADQ